MLPNWLNCPSESEGKIWPWRLGVLDNFFRRSYPFQSLCGKNLISTPSDFSFPHIFDLGFGGVVAMSKLVIVLRADIHSSVFLVAKLLWYTYRRVAIFSVRISLSWTSKLWLVVLLLSQRGGPGLLVVVVFVSFPLILVLRSFFLCAITVIVLHDFLRTFSLTFNTWVVI